MSPSSEDNMRYDLHIHTKYSYDGSASPESIVRQAAREGLDGIAITDHDTIKGALKALRYSRKYGIDVVPGVEVKSSVGDVLCYYVTEEIRSRDFFELADEVKSMGGIVSIAHPFTGGMIRRKARVDFLNLPKGVDAVECFNARMVCASANRKARQVTEKARLAMTAGSDAHFLSEVGRASTVFEGDLASAIRNRKTDVEGTIRNAFFYRAFTLRNILANRV